MKTTLNYQFWEIQMLQCGFLSCSIHTILVRGVGSGGPQVCDRESGT